MSKYDGIICIRQRVLAAYRSTFFNALGDLCKELIVVVGRPFDDEPLTTVDSLANARVEFVDNRSIARRTFLTQRGLSAKIAEIRPDSFITEIGTRFTDFRSIRRHPALRDKPIIGWGLGTTNFWGRKLTTIRRWRHKQVVSLLDGMICYGEVAKAQYQDIGMPADRTFVAFNATAKRPVLADLALAKKRNRTTIVTIGRLLGAKRFDLLIEAIGCSEDLRRDVDLWIVGDGPERKNLEQLALERRVQATFHGALFGEDLLATASCCHLFVLPSLGGLAVQHAMSFGLPVIVTAADGTERDLVRENGVVLENANIQTLSGAIEHLLSDPARLVSMGERSLQIVHKEINVEKMAETFIKVVKTMEELGRR